MFLKVNVGQQRLGLDLDPLEGAIARRVLERQADWLNTYGNVTVTIEGHTCKRGTREHSLALGERRAEVVRDYLVSLGS